MPAPYLTAPIGGGDYPPFEIVGDTSGNPPAATDMLLTIDNVLGAIQLVTSSTGEQRYIGAVQVTAHYTGTIEKLCLMDRGSAAPGTVDHDYANADGVTVKKLGAVVSAVTQGEQYLAFLDVQVP
ncbi:MAG: hypothetical protein AAGA68_25770 [Pseudomonadota bacterium]